MTKLVGYSKNLESRESLNFIEFSSPWEVATSTKGPATRSMLRQPDFEDGGGGGGGDNGGTYFLLPYTRHPVARGASRNHVQHSRKERRLSPKQR